jgi:isopentenyl-diphosphate delta-isomerase
MDRKDSHISICLEKDIELYSENSNGFSEWNFEHDALPEIDFSAIQLETTVLGKKLAAPLIIGAMTGGTERAGEINRRLALAAEKCQVGIALGSQRKMIGHGRDSAVTKSYAVRDHAPGVPLLLGNIGAVQLNYGVTAQQLRALIETSGCDAFNFHLNPLQEAVQPEGDRNFSSLLPKMRDIIPSLGVPVLVKEVGSGISSRTARKLKTLPIAGIETAGAGGTSWSKIEAYRSATPDRQNLGQLFARWGVPTAESVVTCRRELPSLAVIASGGIRNGIEIAKAIALGADAAATALPILKAAERSTEDAIAAIEQLILELRTALFVTGLSSIEELKREGRSVLKQRQVHVPII